VKEVLINGRPLDPEREYVVAANDFMAAGGDGYSTFGDAVRESGGLVTAEGVTKGGIVVYSDSGRWLRDVVMEYIKDEREVSPLVEGRIAEAR
jgi:2',3'-cyclic-nucleotide 2'-phosphodiesterase (5'-nucleotidase family)